MFFTLLSQNLKPAPSDVKYRFETFQSSFLWFFVELDPVVLNRWLSVIKPAYQGDRNSDLEHFDIEGDY